MGRIMDKKILQSVAYGFMYNFNNEVFKLQLPFVIEVTKSQKFNDNTFATFQPFVMDDDSGKAFHFFKFAFARHNADYQELKNSIFHEMVHAKMQELNPASNLAHDAEFWAWEKIAVSYGLTIRYPVDNYGEFENV